MASLTPPSPCMDDSMSLHKHPCHCADVSLFPLYACRVQVFADCDTHLHRPSGASPTPHSHCIDEILSLLHVRRVLVSSECGVCQVTHASTDQLWHLLRPRLILWMNPCVSIFCQQRSRSLQIASNLSRYSISYPSGMHGSIAQFI